MELRPARIDEKDALAQLFRRAEHGMTYLPAMPEEHLPLVAGHIAKHDDVWVAEDAERILGFLAIDRSEGDGPELLAKLYVEPDAQNRGVGAALLDQAKSLYPKGLELWVFQLNEGARRFYERHGFRLVRLTDGAENWEREPDALYRWEPRQ